MKQHTKKQYRPIAGQRWYEKLLDRMTREEVFRWSPIGIWACAGLTFVGVYIFANVLNQPDAANAIFSVGYRLLLPLTILIAAVNPLGGIWDLRAEKTLQAPILRSIEAQGRCTYDELVSRCMPLKIHLGIDSAIETMLLERRLVQDADGCYRLPTDDDRKKWRQEWLEEYGIKIPFEVLARLFALDLKELEEEITIGFSSGELDGCRMGKAEAADSGEDVFWLRTDTGDRLEFTSFQSMAQTRLFDGKSLEEVWDTAVITFLNDDDDMDIWLKEHLPDRCDP